MKRDLYAKLLNWKHSKNRKPLILRGARQVGKTHLLKKFGQKEYEVTVYLNFEADPKLIDFFKEELKPKSILEKIKIYLNQDINPENTLIIFDEIQECPEALNSLKYFQEDLNEYHIASAGSLLGIKLAHTKGFPVGKVNFLELYPLNFFEFLAATERDKLRQFLIECSEDNGRTERIPTSIHEELLTLLKKYMYIGGMPEVINEYIQTDNLLSLREIQEGILKSYEFDFVKHAPKEQVMKISQVWNSIPNHLAKENKKFVFSVVRQGARSREYETAIQWLADAGLIYKSYQISAPRIPLAGYASQNIFKVFMLDVGLLSAMSNIPSKAIIEKNNMFTEFKGAFTENYIAQELSISFSKLYYWTSEGIAEVDFVIEDELSIYPLEVKSGTSKSKKSLQVYADKYNPEIMLRTSLMNLKQDGKVLNVPLYLISQLSAILGNKGQS